MIRTLSAFLIYLLIALPAAAQEQILAFDAEFEVHRDASVTISETITVRAESESIRRGIFRDVPTRLAGPGGREIATPMAVVSVTRNGQPEPYADEGISGGKRIRIGSADVMLAPGVHTYEIVYEMERAARLFSDYDEFYWNATGNFWQFAIAEASARVVLPEGAEIIELNVYTGGQGEAGADAAGQRVSENVAQFTTTAPLAPYEGMTISVAFAKGVLEAPEGVEAARFWLSDYRDYIVPTIALLLVLGYNALAWNAVGRDPAKGVIIPRFHPPRGFSPALVHYVHRMGWANSGWLAYSAALVSLAAKGLVSFEKTGKKTTIRTTGAEPDQALPPGEAVAFNELKSLAPVTIDKQSGPKLDKNRSAFIRALEGENRAVYFKNNLLYVVCGVALGLTALGAMVLLDVTEPVFMALAVFAAILISVITLSVRAAWSGSGIGRFLGLAVMIFVGVNLVAGALAFLDLSMVDYPIVAAVSIIVVTLVFGILMRAPTVHGRKVMDDIDGFRMYLETAEKERLNFRDEPEMTTRRFESILPYAMALGVEKPWSERFQNDLERHAVKDAGTGYSPVWYAGSGFGSGGFAKSMTAMTAGLSSAMISAQPASSSSSGAGGGGFSGGGGGGGGGGGW